MANIVRKKRMRNALFICIGLFLILSIRLGYIQLISGKRLSTLAYEQQT